MVMVRKIPQRMKLNDKLEQIHPGCLAACGQVWYSDTVDNSSRVKFRLQIEIYKRTEEMKRRATGI